MKDDTDDNTASGMHEQASGAADPYGVDRGDDSGVSEAETQRLLNMQHNLEQAEGDDQEEG